MKIILDEQLDPRSADVLNVMESRHDCTFVSLQDLAPPKTQDIEIPNICRQNSAVALVTADVKDFGAKTVHFRALLEAGVSVITLRPQKRASVLVRINNSGISVRDLEDLVIEIDSRGST